MNYHQDQSPSRPRVSITQNLEAAYPATPPFSPGSIYPETPISNLPGNHNDAYTLVRNALHLLDLDQSAWNTPEWNPLGSIIQPGETVFIKPNMISHKHAFNSSWDYVITHGAVIRAVVDYVYIALSGQGRIIIGDAPQTDSDFDEIIERMGLLDLQKLYATKNHFMVEILDLRDEYWITKDGIYVETVKLQGDPCGSVAVDLANHSFFAELDGQGKEYYGAFYDTSETNEHHRDGKHEYAISRTPIEADVFINIPKLKTHKKCGLTVNLKSLVGINANKNWLPHYILGGPEEGGDQFDKTSTKGKLENSIVLSVKKRIIQNSKVMKWLARKLKKLGYLIFGSTEEVVRSGNWHGNDTVWRMSDDLNRILMYANTDGSMRPAGKAKKFFSIVDGIVGMEGNGPVAGTRTNSGIIIAGDNPVAVDAVCAKIMGLDWQKLPLISRCFESHAYPLIDSDYASIQPTSNVGAWNKPLLEWEYSSLLHFKPHFGWVEHVELEE